MADMNMAASLEANRFMQKRDQEAAKVYTDK